MSCCSTRPSAPAGTVSRTINDFVTPGVDMVALVGRSIGFVASHEAGHLLGNWHTQPNNGVVSIMDTFDITQLGLGPDFVFGTADDVDVDFVVDQLTEGHVGAEGHVEPHSLRPVDSLCRLGADGPGSTSRRRRIPGRVPRRSGPGRT